MRRKHNPALTPYARELRKTMTAEEGILWYKFLRTYPVRFLRQKVIDCYIVDFYCSKAKLVVELDGSQHFQGDAPAYDAARTEHLESWGLNVLRFSNREIRTNLRGVCERIDQTVQQRISENENQQSPARRVHHG